ncbi:hypothetical protein AF71_00037200 [Rhizobium sp. 57MFTsu3.2]|nr:hypothetical protein [Rhizobium sp. 57MFTsu3.2]
MLFSTLSIWKNINTTVTRNCRATQIRMAGNAKLTAVLNRWEANKLAISEVRIKLQVVGSEGGADDECTHRYIYLDTTSNNC